MTHIRCNYDEPYCELRVKEFDDIACTDCDSAECDYCQRKLPYLNENGIRIIPGDECLHLGWRKNEFEDDFRTYYFTDYPELEYYGLRYQLQLGKGKNKKVIRYINELWIDGKLVVKDGERI